MTTMTHDDLYMVVSEVAPLRITPPMVRWYANAERLHCIRTAGDAGVRLFPLSEVERFAREREQRSDNWTRGD